MIKETLLKEVSTGKEQSETFRKKYSYYEKQLLAAGVDKETAQHEAALTAMMISDETFSLIEKSAQAKTKETPEPIPENNAKEMPSAITESIIEITGKGKAGQYLTRQAQEYIAANYTAKFSLDAIANHLHVNKSYLARTFKATTGTTLLQYHNQVRCIKAIDYLKNSDYTITQISGLVGFYSSAHFSKVFQKIIGKSPTACRLE